MSEETTHERLTRFFTALGAKEPEQWAAAEERENTPELARYLLLRQIWRDVDTWRTDADTRIQGYLGDPATSELMAEVVDAGVSRQTIGLLARSIALETAFGLTYRLSDSTCDDAPLEIRGELPGWGLMETTPDGEVTARHLGDLYFDLGGTAGEVAERLAPDTSEQPARTTAASVPGRRCGPSQGPLFTYGTLQFDAVLHALLGRIPQRTEDSAPGWRAAALDGRLYPGLVAAPDRTARGLLLTDLSDEEWAILDAFEDDEYDLREVDLASGRKSWTYVWADGDVQEADWDAEHFAAHHLPAYAARCAEDLRTG